MEIEDAHIMHFFDMVLLDPRSFAVKVYGIAFAATAPVLPAVAGRTLARGCALTSRVPERTPEKQPRARCLLPAGKTRVG